MAVSFATNIRPMFTDMDIAHMKNFGVLLDDFGFMRDPANAQKVLDAVSSGAMPPGNSGETSWSPDQDELFRNWITNGYQAQRLWRAACRGRHHEALEEFGAVEHLRSQMADSHALASQVTGWLLATQARAGMTGEARATLAALEDERASSGEIGNARAVICLADGDPAAALAAVADVPYGTAPVLEYVTVIEAHLLAGLDRQLGDQRTASQAAERALALAEADQLILPFAMTGSAELLETLPRHQTAYAALLADILDVLHGSSLAPKGRSSLPQAEELSPTELRVLRYLPTNLSRPEIAGELFVSPNTVNAHVRNIYAKLGVHDRSSAVRRARELRLLVAAGRTR